LYESALKTREKFLGDQHPDMARSMNELAELYLKLGRYEEADIYNQKALEIRRKIFGEDHVDVARSISSLGITHFALGNYERAEQLQKSALQKLEKCLNVTDQNHPKIAHSVYELARLYLKQVDINVYLTRFDISGKIR
jgi:tetratricopeptide (TPR) repeat protein